MSEITIRAHKTKEKNTRPKMLAAVLGVTVLTALGVKTVQENQSPEQPALNEPHKVYTARGGDTEWSIGTRAYPDIDPRKAQDLIDKQNPNKDHLVTPGQEFVFGTDAELGEVIDPTDMSASGARG